MNLHCLFYTVTRVVFLLAVTLSGACAATQHQNTTSEIEKRTVHFAGVAYLGKYNLLEQNYPNALSLNKTQLNGQGQLDFKFIQSVRSSQPKYLNIDFGLANTQKSQSMVMALAIERESVSTEIIGKHRKIIAEVSAQLFFFDFESMSLIANVPLSIAKNHVVPAEQNYESEILPLFSDLYLGTAHKSSKNLLSLAVKTLENVSPDQSTGLRFQLESVSLNKNVTSLLPQSLSETRFSQFVGQYFSARLANQYSVTVLPFTKGYGIGNQMAGRFSNGTVFNIGVPEPDYVFSINVTGLKKAPLNENLMYAARIKFDLTEKTQRKRFLDGHFQMAVAKLVMDSQSEIDDWGAYHDAIEVLIDDLIKQLGEPDKKWFKTHSREKASYVKFVKRKGMFSD